ncbi:catalase [Deinococcus metallilatus]|uniref:Catalase n=1 Tax=Deinococcus metallilatus TaxID=1211322 RepID=A0AAJ5JYG8_9DEIO|nr:catalase [Deinococcus metallilatus]MBB5295458.1 catalase [Deinococcus metallilatus]QBY08021.1 catalase [Deinococcus metallilatus]RXJ12915.1 catalase [Deinococcus metallilatus]TLK27163.1 catalase [Deinococcus metallilatus]GMA16136.1 catalase [Deinococcus metallilatus]
MSDQNNTPEQHTHGTAGTAALGVGSATDTRFAEGEQVQTLTTRQGHPVTNNQNLRTVGNRGPTTLENYHFIEKISHFDRERIPERVVHARGAGAHGVFEAYGTVGDEPVSKYTRAKLFQEKGKQTPVFVRFSTVGHGGHSPETLRDPRGFAVKFYTEDGNWDLVGNNLKVFFIRDAIKFPDLIHSQKPDPVTNRQSGERIFDFICNSPEAMHMVTLLFSPWGIPANYRQMQGSGVNTYKWVNDRGEAVLVKYHWEPVQGIRNLTQPEAEAIQAKNFNHATQDLYEAIERGDYPQWELFVQIMPDGENPELDFDPLDDTKIWPREQFPWLPVGRMTLNRNPENYFAEVEQAAFGTGVLVDGLDFSDDKMLQGRTFAYSDTQRYRVGPNYLQLPINAPKKHVATNQRDGQMTYEVDTAPGQNPHVNYEPSSLNGLREAPRTYPDYTPWVEGKLVRESIDRTNNFGQAGEQYRAFEDWERDDLINNLVANLKDAAQVIQDKMIDLFTQCDADYGRRVREGLAQARQSAGAGKEEAVKQAEERSREAQPY